MTRRQWFVNLARLSLLRWRVLRGRALPVFASALLIRLDAWAKRLEQGRGRP